MSSLTFAQELSARFTANEQFWSLMTDLRSAGITETLLRKPEPTEVTSEGIAKLLYCAEVFVQTDDETLHRHAQEIAIHTLLIAKSTKTDGAVRGRALSVLTELGNFPGLKYVERNLGGGDESLLSLVNRRTAEKLSTVRIGDEDLPLTDYQQKVWRSLPKTQASVVTAPTSAGKSFLVLEYMCRQAENSEHYAAVYVTPTRALLSEVHQRVLARLKNLEGVRISAVPSLDRDESRRQIFVLTQERLSTLLSVAGGHLNFDLVVVDEAQNISEDARGMILQDCLERIAETSRNTKVVLLAPGVDGMPEVAKTLGIDNLVPLSTRLSPVLQNRIVLNQVYRKPHELAFSVMGKNGERSALGSIRVERALNDSKTKLANVAVELGGNDGSLLYETGAREAEKTATHLVNILHSRDDIPRDGSLEELSKFIKDHIHPEYQLANMVRYGVAYHYGKMPSLLREAIENSFKREEGGIRYLVCTTTLAQGVNLPARNVFIDTPNYGRGKRLNPALLWNFVGRAGRLNHDVVGNVFLLDYEKWSSKPMDEFVPFNVKSAIADTLVSLGGEVCKALEDKSLPQETPQNSAPSRIRACAGLMVAHAARKDIRPYLERTLANAPEVPLDQLVDAAKSAYEAIGLPDHILVDNWTIDPFGLRRLYDDIVQGIQEERLSDLIPMNPVNAPYGFYEQLFGRIVTQVNGRSWNFGALAGRLAVEWMRGLPYPVMLSQWVKRRRKSERAKAEAALKNGDLPEKPKTLDSLIYAAFELIEDVVRFQFVQLGKAYRDLLILALRETGHEDRVPNIFDFALALELGISSEAGTAYVELGLSRIAAAALEQLTPPGSKLTAEGARKMLRDLDLRTLNLSPIILDELRRLGLIAQTIEAVGEK